jgi:hypothetical protein
MIVYPAFNNYLASWRYTDGFSHNYPITTYRPSNTKSTFRLVINKQLLEMSMMQFCLILEDSINDYVSYNGYVGVYTSIDLYVNNGFSL